MQLAARARDSPTCEKSFLLGVVFVYQRVTMGTWTERRQIEPKGAHTMSYREMQEEARCYYSDAGYRESLPCGECGKVGGCEHFPTEHSASRRIDVLAVEAPHLIDSDDVRRRVGASVGDRIVIGDRSFILDARNSSDPLGVGRSDGDHYILREVD